jgi:hypothetical protein
MELNKITIIRRSWDDYGQLRNGGTNLMMAKHVGNYDFRLFYMNWSSGMMPL